MSVTRSLTFLASPWSLAISALVVLAAAGLGFVAWRRSGYHRSFGILEDEAARTNGSALAQDVLTNTLSGVSSNFDYSFAPLSMTLVTFEPVAPRLVMVPPLSPGNPSTVQLQGQAGVRYVVQTSTNLAAWINLSTNTLTSDSLDLTDPVGSGPQYWRAVWQP